MSPEGISEALFEPVELDSVNAGRYPIPPGWATPTELTHILRVNGIINNLSPQQIYTGFIKKRNSDFPWALHIDGRKIVPVKEATEWIVRWLQEKAEREADKAAIAARKAEAALIATNLLLEPEVDETEDTEIEGPDEWGSEWTEFN